MHDDVEPMTSAETLHAMLAGHVAVLRGRSFMEAPDITSRICGICTVAYPMSTCHAMEDVLGVRVAGPLRALRRLLYCGDWIESHALHVFLLHLPDFLG